ncbi:hypothetical protein TcasGA2_TC008370 [Tribolium castaneum]|uniref:Uncharacterized protein n=1 Tax=Tribolium castaneum TaxID=7070 RepID=D2A1C6_TRICA|nr:hypothetical protein TcasGA2_TC008370 [Tribolium castaneum]
MALTPNPLMPNLGVKPPLSIDRTHYSSSGGSSHSHGSKGGGKHSIALTALTLLAFLFFLNILQNCLQEHMDEMNPQVVVMQAKIQETRQIEAQKRKGESELNSTLVKESREETKPQNQYMAQIPVKLRTSEKAVKP